MSKTDLRIIKTKDAIHRALVTLLEEQTLQDITITELCRTANINRGTFYLHYTQVEDVFEENTSAKSRRTWHAPIKSRIATCLC